MAKLNNTKKSGKNVADDKERLASEIAARYDPNSETYKYRDKTPYQSLREKNEISTIPRTYESQRYSRSTPEGSAYRQNQSSALTTEDYRNAANAYVTNSRRQRPQPPQSRNPRSSYYNPNWQKELTERRQAEKASVQMGMDKLAAERKQRLQERTDKATATMREAINAADFDQYVRLGKSKAAEAESKFNATFRSPQDAAIRRGEAYSNRAMSATEMLDWMGDYEKGTYYYLLGKDEAKANAFLDLLGDSLNARRGQHLSAYMDSRGLIGKAGSALAGGLSSAASGMSNAASAVFNGEARPTTSNEYASQIVRENIDSKVGRALYDVGYTGANMLPSIGVSLLAGGLGAAPKIASLLGSSTLGISAGGNAYKEGRDSGYTHKQALAYGTLVGASEAGLQAVLGGISSLGLGITEEAAGGAISRALGKVIKNTGVTDAIGRYIANMGSEATEEYLQSLLEPVFKNVVAGEQNEFNPLDEEALYSGLMGALTAGLFESPRLALNIRGARHAEREFNAALNSMQRENTAAQEQSPVDIQRKAAKGVAGNEVEPPAAINRTPANEDINRVAETAAKAAQTQPPTNIQEAAAQAAEKAVQNPLESQTSNNAAAPAKTAQNGVATNETAAQPEANQETDKAKTAATAIDNITKAGAMNTPYESVTDAYKEMVSAGIITSQDISNAYATGLAEYNKSHADTTGGNEYSTKIANALSTFNKYVDNGIQYSIRGNDNWGYTAAVTRIRDNNGGVPIENARDTLFIKQGLKTRQDAVDELVGVSHNFAPVGTTQETVSPAEEPKVERKPPNDAMIQKLDESILGGREESVDGSAQGDSSPVRKMQESNGREQAKKAGVRGVPERDTQSNIHGRSGSLQGELPGRQRDARNTERRIEKQAAATNPQDALATTIADTLIKKGTAFNSSLLFELADKAYGGTMADGTYTVKDAYDAMELAVNKTLLSVAKDFNGDVKTAVRAVNKLQSILDKLPTQTKRTEEQTSFQQFSTPPNIAFLAAWAANINDSDVVLEPSAGIGGLAVFPKAWGADVVVNELSERRLAFLKNMGFDRVFNENAEQINNVLPDDVKPSIVIMNPPFSSTAGRTATNKTSNAIRHVEQALQRLEDGGRLVAILGRGMANDTASFKSWWDSLRQEYDVRANISIDGSNYKKYGTSFDVQLAIIDKTGPQKGETLTGTYKNLTEIPAVLEGIRNDRIAVAGSLESGNGRGIVGLYESESDNGRNRGIRPVHDGKPANTELSSMADRTGDTVSSVTGQRAGVQKDNSRSIQPSTGSIDGRGIGNSTSGISAGMHDGTKGDGERPNTVGHERTPASGVKRKKTKSDNGVYADYEPAKLPIKGAKPHPTKLVESSAMASVPAPVATYTPNLPQELITSGALSSAQLENIVYAGQAHQQTLSNGSRKGYFIGDGTGVGKGREIAGIILDNFRQGRNKAVWVSVNPNMVIDATRDWTGLGQNKDDIMSLSKVKLGKPIAADSGILFASYNTLASSEGEMSRLQQIVDWLGKDFDGVIAFDEAHKMNNLMGKQGARGKTAGSQMAKAGVELQRMLPNARVVYVSATGATDVSGLAFAERLGLWGRGTAFNDAKDFVSKIGSSGIAAMELVSRDMKASGVYLARSISYDGVTYDTLQHTLTPTQTKIYNTMSKAWQITLQNVQAALKETGASKAKGIAKSSAISQYYSAIQRFYNQVLTSMSMPSVIDSMKKELAAGHSCVLQLVNTNEAEQERQVAKIKDTNGSLDDLDITPRGVLIGYLENSFPVQVYEDYTDENGNTYSRPVYDSHGNPVLDKKAIAMRDALIEQINEMSVPDGPLDMLFDAFGSDAVAEVSGRKRRIVSKTNENGETVRVEERRSAHANDAEIQAFQDGKKRILVFSGAGNTGKSYHSDLNAKNQQQRIHYLLQPGWNASEATQGFGRTHRSNQANTPKFVLVTTNVSGQKRFVSTIARRLDQLGALTKGQRETGAGMFSDRDNLETQLARDSLRMFYERLGKGLIDGIDGMSILEKLGLKKDFVDEFGNFKVKSEDTARDMGRFLNRILALEVDEQNRVFDEFYSLYEEQYDKALKDGTLDRGLENVKADRVEILDDKVVRTDKSTGATTNYVQAKTYTKSAVLRDVNKLASLRQGFQGLYKTDKGSVVAVYKIADKTNERGEVKRMFRAQSPVAGKFGTWNETTLNEHTKKLEKSEWKTEWASEVAKAPEYDENTVHMLTGALLPIWDILPQEGNTRAMRITAEDGSQYLGRVIPANQIDGVLSRLGAGKRTLETFDTRDVMQRVMNGDTVKLSGEHQKIQRSRVSNEYRIEITGKNLWALPTNYPGIFVETINWQKRYFIPTGEKGVAILESIVKDNPISEIKAESNDFDLMAVGESSDAVSWWNANRVGDRDKKSMPISDIINKMRHDFGIPIGKGRMPRKDARGRYSKHDFSIRTRVTNDLPAVSHELGHHLDNVYKLTQHISKDLENELINQLPAEFHEKYAARKLKGEGLAEFVRRYLQNKDLAAIDYPLFIAHFENTLSADALSLVNSFADEINAYYSLDEGTAVSSIRNMSDRPRDFRTTKERTSQKASEYYQKWVDEFHGIELFDRAAGSNAHMSAINSAYSDAIAYSVLTGDLTDANGSKRGEGLGDILSSINMKDKTEWAEFGEYLVVRHGPERLSEGMRIFADDRKNSAFWMQQRQSELETMHPEFADAAERLDAFQRNVLQAWGVETGLVSEESAHKWAERWEHYVPLNRAIDKQNANGAKRGFANQTSTIFKARGSGADIIHPVDNIINNTVKMINAGIRNGVMLDIRNAALKTKGLGSFIEKMPTPTKAERFNTSELKETLVDAFVDAGFTTADTNTALNIVSNIDDFLLQFKHGVKPNGNMITVLVNGKPEYWKVNDPMLLESLTSMSRGKTSEIVEWYGAISRLMTSNITGLNLIWSIGSNTVRDLGTLVTYSKDKNIVHLISGLIKAYTNSFKAPNKQDPMYKEFLAVGGGSESAYTADRDMTKNIRAKLSGSKQMWLNPIQWIEALSNVIERGPRYATYKMMRDAGMTPQEAIYESHNITVNFRRGGSISRQVNKVVPFFNASVQGVDRLISWLGCKDIPKAERTKAIRNRVGWYVAAYGMLGLLQWFINSRDDEDEKYYAQLSNYTKNNFWCIPIYENGKHTGEYITIPKPRELAVPSTVISNLMELVASGNKRAFGEFDEYVLDSYLPNVADDTAKGIVGFIRGNAGFEDMTADLLGNLGVIGIAAYAMANRDFLGKPIESAYYQNLEKRDRYNDRTSKLAYLIGQAFNESPIMVDYVGQQLFGGFWKTQKALLPMNPDKADYTLGLSNTYRRDSQYSTDLINDMYDIKAKATLAYNSDKDNMEKAIAYKEAGSMATFYSNYNKLEGNSNKATRQIVLDMIDEFVWTMQYGERSEIQKRLDKLCTEMGDTSYMCSALNPYVKDDDGNRHNLTAAQYVEYQGLFNSAYWQYVGKALMSSDSTQAKAIAVNQARARARSEADGIMLSRLGVDSKYSSQLAEEKAVGLTADDSIAFRSALDEVDAKREAEGSNLSKSDVYEILDSMDLTDAQRAYLYGNLNYSEVSNIYYTSSDLNGWIAEKRSEGKSDGDIASPITKTYKALYLEYWRKHDTSGMREIKQKLMALDLRKKDKPYYTEDTFNKWLND